FSKIKEYLKGKKVVGCLITHFHGDHIGALEEVLSYYDLDINKINSKKFKFVYWINRFISSINSYDCI
ncbi:MAG: MBL fold metallo-hydrolase, partial [Bacteroidales bacterium]|nr:MBL fold metallo-hydrolase [Bacteroidales bacterium]